MADGGTETSTNSYRMVNANEYQLVNATSNTYLLVANSLPVGWTETRAIPAQIMRSAGRVAIKRSS